ncbi:MAG: CAAD domain-containing protein [Heteroscytonema crispum UTEX LB 1556]
MESQVQERNYVDENYSNEMPSIAVAQPDNESALAPVNKANDQMELMGQKVSNFFAQLPDNTARFVQEYKLPVISFALMVATIISLRVLLALLDAVNDIPLVAPFFELIGISYTAWFVNRYLFKAETRKELGVDINLLKKEMVGKEASDPASEI